MILNYYQPHESNLINLLKDSINLLSWREAGFGKLPETISKQICVTELIGPNGFFDHSNIRIGLLLQKPETNYPWHHHAAEELYFILSGKAYWAVDKKETKIKFNRKLYSPQVRPISLYDNKKQSYVGSLGLVR